MTASSRMEMLGAPRLFVAELKLANGVGWTSLHTTRGGAAEMLDDKADDWGIDDVDTDPQVAEYGISLLPVEDVAYGVVIDFASWTRLAELLDYAEQRKLPIAAAINNLVNAGLSHWTDR